MPKKREESRPEKFLATVRSNQIFMGLLQGKSVQQIADDLGVPEESISRTITTEKQKMTIATQEMMERYLTVTTTRTEWLLGKILRAVERQTEGDGEILGPARDLLSGALQIMKFQKDLLVPDNKNGDVKVQINQTFNSKDPLYDYALQHMQTEYMGETVHKTENEQPMVVTLPPEFARLEDLATKYEVKEDDSQLNPDE